MNKEIFISAGDISGDLHASNLISAIKKYDKDITVTSLGGYRLASVCDNFLFNLVDLNVHGFWEPIKQYFNLKKVFNSKVVTYLKKKKPNLLILVDYYGFNIKIAEFANSLNIPVYYFISPQIWATRYNRIKKIKKYIKHMFVIFPFEEVIYRKENIPVTYVGHPLLDIIPEIDNFSDFNTETYKIGLFPGSRKSVIKWNLPIMEKTAKIVAKEIKNTHFFIIGLSNLKESYEKSSLEVLYDVDYDTRKQLNLALTVSGTVSLENALLGIPMIIIYHLPWLMYFFIKSIIQVSNISITNILANKQITPELIQHNATPENISKLIISWLKNPEIMMNIRKEYIKLRTILGEKGAIDNTARIITNLLS
jgi:lipid-A-disaccharide synthase